LADNCGEEFFVLAHGEVEKIISSIGEEELTSQKGR
jgi:hypothetical protein